MQGIPEPKPGEPRDSALSGGARCGHDATNRLRAVSSPGSLAAAHTYAYEAFGRAILDAGNTLAEDFNVRSPGQYYDGETGLHDDFNRCYDPSVGRHISADPIGELGVLAPNARSMVVLSPETREFDPFEFPRPPQQRRGGFEISSIQSEWDGLVTPRAWEPAQPVGFSLSINVLEVAHEYREQAGIKGLPNR